MVRRIVVDALEYLVSKYEIDLNAKSPIEIPDVGRNSIPYILNQLQFKTGAEIGVARGVYTLKIVQCNPKMKMFAIDPYAYPEIFVGCQKIAHDKLAPYPNVEFICKSSMDAVTDFKDNSLDFVYIDANHIYEYVLQDIVEWQKKVRPGGIVAGHDYYQTPKKDVGYIVDVKRAVREYTSNHNIHPWFILGAKSKVQGEIRDKCRSWLWVK